MKTESKRPGSEEGYYWVECSGSVEILFRKTPDGSESDTHWYRPGNAMPVSESEIDFIYPGLLRAPAYRMDNSVEEELGDLSAPSAPSAPSNDPAGNHACHDCGIEYPFQGLNLFLPDEEWKQIAPSPDGRGILCPNCISIRAEGLDSTVCLEAKIKRWNPQNFKPLANIPPFDAAPDEEL